MKYQKLKKNRGFVLLFAVTLAALLLSIALGVANIALREVKFSTSAKDANNAFFAADTGSEYALFGDKSTNNFYALTPAEAGTRKTFPPIMISGLGSDGASCAIIGVTKDNTNPPNTLTTIISDGYNTGGGGPGVCSPGINAVERELKTTYGGSPLPNPIVWWKFDEASGSIAIDSSGSGNNGNVNGTAIVAGINGNARNFTAATDSIIIPTSSILDTDTHTISFWLNINQTPPVGYSQLLAFRPSGTDRSPGIWINPSLACLHWRYDPGNTGPAACGGPNGENTYFTIGAWYHVVGVKDGSTFTLYVNGSAVESGNVSNPKTSGSAQLEIGKASYDSGFFEIDDLRIYNQALTAAQVLSL